MYLLYKKKRSLTNDLPTIDVKDQKIDLLHLFLPYEEKSLKIFFFRLCFFIMALGKIWIYYCTDDSNRIVHTSYVLHSKFKFAFSKKNELEIGPCHTNKTFRNKGLYKNVVKRITSDEKFEGQSFFMIVEENNFPSIRGIESSGFKKFGCIKKTKFIKIYRIVDENS